MSSCNEYILKMNMYLDGELPANQLSDLMEHIDSCGSCRRRFEGLKVTAFEMRQMDEPMPDMLHAAIMRHVRENCVQNQRRKWVQKLLPVAACALFLIMASTGTIGKLTGVYLFGETEKSATVSPETAASADQAVMPEATLRSAAPEANNDVAGNSNKISPSGFQTTPLGEVSREVITLPTLYLVEEARFYVVAAGDADIAPLFPAGDTFAGENEGEYYCLVRDSAQEWSDVSDLLVQNGITVFENVENLPPVSEDATFAMVVYFKDMMDDTY